jgi:DNA repair exonuclease SbcCD nuclease subunit
MKILACGDLHLTNVRPRARKDHYADTVLRKFSFILQTAVDYNCRGILQPADMFDIPLPSYSFFAEIYSLVRRYGKKISTIPGQHDMKQRNFDNTGLYALSETND